MGTFLLLAAVVLFFVGMWSPKTVRMSRKMTLLLVVVLLGLVISLAPKRTAEEKQAQIALEKTPLSKEITAPFITPDSKLHKLFGKERSATVELDRIAFAQELLDDKKCKTLDYVAVSEKSTKNQAKFFADCTDPKQRFFKDEGRSGVYTGETIANANISDSAALSQCRNMISAQATFKSKVDFSLLNTGIETTANGITRVAIGFEAMNGLGNMLPYTALCEFPPNSKATINIQPN